MNIEKFMILKKAGYEPLSEKLIEKKEGILNGSTKRNNRVEK